MKIVHIIHGLGNGGIEKILYDVVCHTPNIEHVVVSLSDFGLYGKRLEEHGVRVYTLNVRRNLFRIVQLIGILHQQRPDIVQTWMHAANFVGGVCAKIAGVKKIIWSIYWSELMGVKNHLIEKLNAWLSHVIPVAILCCAESAKNARVRAGYCATKMKIIFNGYDAQEFIPDIVAKNRLREQYQIDLQCVVLGLVARVHAQKDHMNLLMAVSQVRHLPIKLLLVGDGTDSNPFISGYIAEHALVNQVVLCGFQKNLHEYMSMFDVFVLSSNAEGFPNVVNEAMLCATPCIVTDVGDCAYIVGDTGMVVPPQNSAALAEAITKMVGLGRAAIAERGKFARERVMQNFNLDKMLRGYNSLYLELMNKCVA